MPTGECLDDLKLFTENGTPLGELTLVEAVRLYGDEVFKACTIIEEMPNYKEC